MADTPATSPGGNVMARLQSYVKTQKGFILTAEIVLSLIVLICYAASYYGGYTAVAIVEMVMAIIFFVVFMMEFDKQFRVVHWVWSDLIRAAVGALVYIITSLICVIRGGGDGALIAGGVFGLIAGLVFAYDAYTIFQQIKGTQQHSAAPTDDRV